MVSLLASSAAAVVSLAFTAVLQVRQRGVVRKPAHVHNYVHNAQMVVDALAGPILNMDLSHITGEAIVRGDTVAIRWVGDTFDSAWYGYGLRQGTLIRPPFPPCWGGLAHLRNFEVFTHVVGSLSG